MLAKESNGTETMGWEYCQIDLLVQDDARDRTWSDNKLMWFQFVARVTRHKEQRIIGRSTRVPVPNMTGALAYAPQQNNIAHQNIFDIFLQSLQQDGWELLPHSGHQWWQKNLRRTLRQPSAIRPRLSTYLIGAFIFALLLLVVYVASATWSAPFPTGVREYAEQEVVENLVAPYRTGKVVIVNLTDGMLDPLQAQLPDAIRAERKDEVGTVVWVDCHVVASWRRARSNCLVSVIDLAQAEKVAVATIEGSKVHNSPPRLGEFQDYGLEILLRDEAAHYGFANPVK
ncbi:MAG: hypothetical protein AAF614_08135 [Chloroflexota bacterium]